MSDEQSVYRLLADLPEDAEIIPNGVGGVAVMFSRYLSDEEMQQAIDAAKRTPAPLLAKL